MDEVRKERGRDRSAVRGWSGEGKTRQECGQECSQSEAATTLGHALPSACRHFVEELREEVVERADVRQPHAHEHKRLEYGRQRAVSGAAHAPKRVNLR